MIKGFDYCKSAVAVLYADASQNVQLHHVKARGKLPIRTLINFTDMEIIVPARFQVETALPLIILADKSATKAHINPGATRLMMGQRDIQGDVVLCFCNEEEDDESTFCGATDTAVNNVIAFCKGEIQL